MIVVDSPPALNAREEQQRREVLALLATIHLIYEVQTVDEFRTWLDEKLQELQAAGFAPAIRRVILMGPADGEVCAMIKQRLAPGAIFRVLPVPEAWAFLWRERDRLVDVARRAG